MLNKISVSFQYLLPQHLLSTLMGRIAESHQPWLKNFLIRRFMKVYNIDLQEAVTQNPYDFPTFNSFFIRELKPELRPICPGKQDIASPVDGTISEIGYINQNQLLQAKNHYFDLETLLGNDKKLAQLFYNGAFATLYLAPHNYHRVHMPSTGQLEKTIYVPGKLFSVNRMTTELIPGLYSRNERFISIFNTDAGKIAVILVGAMIVGSIQTVWMRAPIAHSSKIITEEFSNGPHLTKGDQLGFFSLGSTVIILSQQNTIEWSPSLQSNSLIKVGQFLGKVIK